MIITTIGILAVIVIVAINPNRQLAQVRDAERQSEVNNLHKALEQYLIDTGEYPAGISFVSQEVCAPGGSVDCIDLSGDLVPTYLAAIPVDPEASDDGSGYSVSVHPLNEKVSVSSMLPELTNDISINSYISQNSLLVHFDSSLDASYPGTGTDWFDLSGNDNHAILYNGSFFDEGVAESIYTDGVNDYVRFSLVNDISGSEPWTLSIWQRIDVAENGGGRQGWSVWQGPGVQSSNQLISIGVHSQAIESAHWGNDFRYSSGGITFDEWQHVLITYDGFNTERLYLDGQLVQQRNTSQLQITSGDWYFSSRAGSTEFLRAHFGHFALYDRTLGDQEIQRLFLQTRGRFE